MFWRRKRTAARIERVLASARAMDRAVATGCPDCIVSGESIKFCPEHAAVPGVRGPDGVQGPPGVVL